MQIILSGCAFCNLPSPRNADFCGKCFVVPGICGIFAATVCKTLYLRYMANQYLSTSVSQRFTALDVLRGLTIAAMLVVNNPGSWSEVYAPLLHADFNGLTPTDFVFPSFMFVMGFSIFLSLRRFSAADRSVALRKVGGRTLKIFAVGLLINMLSMLVFRGWRPETLRLMGVLQRLALCYGAVGLMVIAVGLPSRSATGRRERDVAVAARTGEGGGRWMWKGWLACLLILLGYGWLLKAGGGYELSESNIVAVVDRAVLGESHMYHGEGFAFDPEGLLSTLPGIAHVLMGYLVAACCSSAARKDRVVRLLAAGAVLTVAGVVAEWCGVPYNKKVWSPSFVLVTCGAASLMLTAFDVVLRGGCPERVLKPLKVMGMNCIAVFVISDVLAIALAKTGWGATVYVWLAGMMEPARLASLVYALLFLVLNLAIAWGLYKKRIFIKL